MINMFPTSAIDPFPKSGFPGGDPYDQYTDLFAALFTFPAPAPAPLSEPVIQAVDAVSGETLPSLNDTSEATAARPFSDGMADILGLFPSTTELKKKSSDIEPIVLPSEKGEPKNEDARFLGPPIPAIPTKPVEVAPAADSLSEPPEDVCSMPVDGKVPSPKLDVKNTGMDHPDIKVGRRKHEDDHPVELEILEMPTDPLPPSHKLEKDTPREIQPRIVSNESLKSNDLMAAAAAGALNSAKPQPVDAAPKIWTADLKEHKIAKKVESTLLETFTNNVIPDTVAAMSGRGKAAVKSLWDGAETFVEIDKPVEERPQSELATEFSFESALNGGSALGKTEKAFSSDIKAKRLILDQVGSSLTDLALRQKEGVAERVLKIKLKPAELGTVEITLSKNADGVIDAHFKTDNPHTQHLLGETLAQLRDSLENSGMKVGNLETSCSNSFTGGNAGGERERQTFVTPREQQFEQPQFSTSAKTSDESKQNRLLNLRA